MSAAAKITPQSQGCFQLCYFCHRKHHNAYIYYRATLCYRDYDMALCLSVCLSICLSVTSRSFIKTTKHVAQTTPYTIALRVWISAAKNLAKLQ